MLFKMHVIFWAVTENPKIMLKGRSIDYSHLGIVSVGYNKSLKIYFIHSHLGFFSDNMETVSHENGERFYKDASEIEKRYSGHQNEKNVS